MITPVNIKIWGIEYFFFIPKMTRFEIYYNRIYYIDLKSIIIEFTNIE